MHLGYLETDGSHFWLSSKVLRFSGSYLASSRLPRVLQPALERLAAQTGEAFSAVVLNGDEVVIVARSSASGGPYTDIATLGANVTSYSNSVSLLSSGIRRIS